MKTILIIALVIALVIFGPFLTIWAVNTLFPVLAIPYGIDTWAATILLGAFFGSNNIKFKA